MVRKVRSDSLSTEGKPKKPAFFSRLFLRMPEMSSDDEESLEDLSMNTSETGGSSFADDHLRDASDSFSTDQETDDDESLESSDSQDLFDQDIRSRHARASRFMKEGNIEKALKIFEDILASLIERYGKEHRRVASAFHNVGIANLRAGNLKNAMEAMKEAVRMRKDTLDPADPVIADSLVELGIILLSLKEYSESLDTFHEALDLREYDAQDLVLPGDIQDNELKTSKVMNNIGCVYYERGDYNEAREAFEEAIRLHKKSTDRFSLFSFSDPATKPGILTMASTLSNKGDILHKGDAHTRVVIGTCAYQSYIFIDSGCSVNSTGYVEVEERKFSSAVATFIESLETQKKLPTSDERLVINTLDNLGYAYCMQSKFQKALSAYTELYSIQDKSQQTKDKDRESTLRKMIYTQVQLRQFNEALEYLCKLEAIQLEYFDEDSKKVRQTRRLMGQVNYQILKFPTISKTFGLCHCGALEDGSDDINLSRWTPSKPFNSSKMSGHRVTCA